MDKQRKEIDCLKSHRSTKLFQILVCIHDFVDDPLFTQNCKLLHQLYIRGRHQYISIIRSTQGYTGIHPVVFKHMAQMFVFRLRNAIDLEACIEEMSGVYDKKTLHQLYSITTSKQHSFCVPTL